VAGEGAATGAELYVGHGTVWVNGDNGYIAMQVSGLEVLPGAGLTDSGYWQLIGNVNVDSLDLSERSGRGFDLRYYQLCHTMPQCCQSNALLLYQNRSP